MPNLIGKYPMASLKSGRPALPGHTILSPNRRDVTALKDYLGTKTATLKTSSANIILDSEMILNQNSISAFFEKIAASAKTGLTMLMASTTPKITSRVATSAKTLDKPLQNTASTVIKNVKPKTALPSSSIAVTPSQGKGAAQYVKGSPIPPK